MSPRWVIGLQIGAVAAGLVASLVPGLPRTQCFWGAFRTWVSVAPHQVYIHEVEPGSPADAAGLRISDYVLSIDGLPINGPDDWDGMARRLQPGQEAQLRVKRGGEEL